MHRRPLEQPAVGGPEEGVDPLERQDLRKATPVHPRRLAVPDPGDPLEYGVPRRAVPRQQTPLARLQVEPPRAVLGQPGQFDLYADELAARVAPLLQPVGVDQARTVVAWGGEDLLQEPVVCAHGWFSPDSPEHAPTERPDSAAAAALWTVMARKAVTRPPSAAMPCSAWKPGHLEATRHGLASRRKPVCPRLFLPGPTLICATSPRHPRTGPPDWPRPHRPRARGPLEPLTL
jgi:hypothetical protein